MNKRNCVCMCKVIDLTLVTCFSLFFTACTFINDLEYVQAFVNLSAQSENFRLVELDSLLFFALSY